MIDLNRNNTIDMEIDSFQSLLNKIPDVSRYRKVLRTDVFRIDKEWFNTKYGGTVLS